MRHAYEHRRMMKTIKDTYEHMHMIFSLKRCVGYDIDDFRLEIKYQAVTP
jgi:hypothetical protein